jgi:hypothetical protein
VFHYTTLHLLPARPFSVFRARSIYQLHLSLLCSASLYFLLFLLHHTPKTLFFSAALRPRGSCTGGVLYRLTPIFCYRVACKISVEITVLLGRPPQRACVRVRLSVVISPGRLSCIMLLKEGRASLDGLEFSGWAWLISCHFYSFIEGRV